MESHKVYVASSLANPHTLTMMEALRLSGHTPLDFTTKSSFTWEERDPKFADWNSDRTIAEIEAELTFRQFYQNLDQIEDCDTLLLLLPGGLSAHLELGYAAGMRKNTLVVVPVGCKFRPETMYLLADYRLEGITAAVSLLNTLPRVKE